MLIYIYAWSLLCVDIFERAGIYFPEKCLVFYKNRCMLLRTVLFD